MIPLDKKLNSPPTLIKGKFLCFWSDLLGFGNVFFDKSWRLNDNDRIKIYKRLQNAHNIFYRHTTPIFETGLVLNDGIVRLYYGGIKENCSLNVSLFIRGCLQIHNEINKSEKQIGLPGTRSVLTYGESIRYTYQEITFDDYITDSKKQHEIISKDLGNPTIIYNPWQMQMNTAFSKAYLLESAGTKVGIKGNGFYIEKSVLNYIKRFSKIKNCETIERKRNKYREFFILPETGNYVEIIMGFKFNTKILKPIIKNWKPNVYQLEGFYPNDEAISDSEIKVMKNNYS